MSTCLLRVAVIAITGLGAVQTACAATIAYAPGASSGIYYDTTVTGGFSDTYAFSILQTSDVSVSLSSTPYANLTLSDLGVFDAANTELTTFTQGQQASALGAGTGTVTLAAGSYTIGVTGSFASPGSYTGVLSVGAVPLPGSFALFGLALLAMATVGAVGRKRLGSPATA